MKPARKYAQVSRRFYRSEQTHCPVCQRRLRRAVTVTERTVITLEEVIKMVHAGYRCPDTACEGHQRTYRSVRADALALLVGRLRLREHQMVDEIHQELLRAVYRIIEPTKRLSTGYHKRFPSFCSSFSTV